MTANSPRLPPAEPTAPHGNRAGPPAATVAAVVERGGRFLMVVERSAAGLCLNQPAGHLEPGESLLAACVRETLEETARSFTPTALLGVYLWRSGPAAPRRSFVRFAFTGTVGDILAGRALDRDIIATVWLSAEELAQRRAEHRSPLVMQCVDDYLRGRRYPLDLLVTHPDALDPCR